MQFFKQSALVSTSRFSEKMLAFFIIIYAARVLGSAGLGEYFFYFSLASLFIPLMDVGFVQVLLQRWHALEEEPRHELMTHFFLLKLLFGCFSLLLCYITDLLIHGRNADHGAMIAAFLAIYLEQISSLLRAPDYTMYHVRYEVIAPLVSRFVTLVGLILLGSSFVDGKQLLYIYAFSSAVGVIISMAGLHGYYPTRIKAIRWHNLVNLVATGFPFSISSFCAMLSLYVDSVILGYFSMSQVGLYNAAYRIIIVGGLISGGITYAVYPRLVRWHSKGDWGELNRSYQAILNAFFLFFGSMMLGGIIFGPKFIRAVYGAEFAAAGLVFQMLSPLMLIIAYTSLMGQTLEAMGMQKRTMQVLMSATVFNLIGNLLIIPFLGMYGAAIVTVGTQLVAIVQLVMHLNNYTEIKFQMLWFKRGLLFLSLMLVGFLWLNYILPIWLGIPLGIALFFALLVPLRRYWLGEFQLIHIGRGEA